MLDWKNKYWYVFSITNEECNGKSNQKCEEALEREQVWTAYNLLSEDEIAGIAWKAARLTKDEAKLLKIPKGGPRPNWTPTIKPSVSIKAIERAVARVKAERDLLLSVYRQLHATNI